MAHKRETDVDDQARFLDLETEELLKIRHRLWLR